MKEYNYIPMRIFFIIFLFIFEINSQEIEDIDPSIIQSLTLEQLQELQNLNLNESNSVDDQRNEKPLKEESLEQKELIEKPAEDSKFGIDYFSKIPTTISPTQDLPVPGDYKISLNDRLSILLSGSKDARYVTSVNLDGTIQIPELGSLSVVNLSLNDLNDLISNLVNETFVGVQANVTLTDLSAKKITIVGAVEMPGTYLVNPFTTISSVLAYSGGIKEYGSIRKIQVIKPNGNTHIFDLYDLLIFGDRSKDITLDAGDTVIIKATNNHVTVKGEVIRPKIYEYLPDDKYLDLIEFALGPNRKADKSNISATINQKGKKITKTVNSNNLIGDQDIEELYLGATVTINSRDAFVTGKAVTSGYYSASNQKLSDFLKNLRFSSEIYPFYATFEKISASGLVKEMKSFSLADPSSYSDLRVSQNTRLNFFNREDILNYQNQENENIEDNAVQELILNSDDFISLSLPEKNMRIPVKGKITPKQIHLFFGSSNQIDESKVSVITSRDSYTSAYEDTFSTEDLVAISLPSIKNDNLIEVNIGGEVFSPGTYLIASSTSLFDLYILAGGFRESAFERGVALYREDVKERQSKAIKEAKAVLTDAILQKTNSNISQRGMVDIEAIIELADLIEPTGRVAGEFYEKSDASRNFILKAGDSIIVPSKSSEVVVQGEVLNSSSFIFDKSLKYSDYIEAAGGFSDYADRRSVFIIKSNGLSITVGSSVFSGQADIEPGDVIVVPRNLDQLEPLPLISMATKIIADIAFSAASLNAIQD